MILRSSPISWVVLFFNFIFCNALFHKVVKKYDTLHADHLKHNIVKRGLQDSDHPYNKIKEVSFSTLGREFRLILTPKKGILHSEFSASSVDENGEETPIIVDHESFYEGRQFGESDSQANVHIDDGVMTASIHIGDETYHVEPSWRHLPESDNRTMVAYRGSDVHLSWDHQENEETRRKPCAYVKEGKELEMEGNETIGALLRSKRQIDSYDPYETKPNKTRCPLLLVADYRFFQEMGGSDTKTTINYLVFILNSIFRNLSSSSALVFFTGAVDTIFMNHVLFDSRIEIIEISLIDRVHKIYNDTNWLERTEADGFNGMGFVIKKILVHSEPTRVRSGEAHYNMVREKWDVRTLLEVFSREYTHKDYCLAHLFTDLKFEGGILGLAYVGSPRRNSVGGICTPEYFKNGYTLYLNSGLSSSRNHYGQRVITREADLVTAHEFGHNWGSEHDPDIPECSPSASQGGSFLMYTYSVSGYDVNNKKFSPCSLRSIRKVLQAKSGRCFSEPQESFCGNLRVEKNEECDAGLLGTEDNDSCCNKFCKLRRGHGAVCSDKNSPCCQNCQFMPAQVKCRDAQYPTCEQESRCTGKSADCPPSPPMPDGTVCLERGQCRGGKCIPFCETLGKQSCMCDVVPNSCKRCCRPSMNDTCEPIEPVDILPNGTPCIQGFCNEGICEKTVQDVVERFWDIIEEININKLLLFLRDNVVGTVILLTALIWIPASFLISYFDKKRLRKEEKRKEWNKREDIMYFPATSDVDYYPRKIIHARIPHRNLGNPPTSSGN
ncbi:ADAM 17-like protease isoform X2 [Planococcus citri]|uniref:ADAM 17-like protease isoform X2 n=1 Tax=Planococcus citri TaxID=170843 RepID=UPI0031F9BC82